MVLDLLGMVGHVIAGDLKGVHSRVLQCLELVPANLKDFPQVLLLMILFCHVQFSSLVIVRWYPHDSG